MSRYGELGAYIHGALALLLLGFGGMHFGIREVLVAAIVSAAFAYLTQLCNFYAPIAPKVAIIGTGLMAASLGAFCAGFWFLVG